MQNEQITTFYWYFSTYSLNESQGRHGRVSPSNPWSKHIVTTNIRASAYSSSWYRGQEMSSRYEKNNLLFGGWVVFTSDFFAPKKIAKFQVLSNGFALFFLVSGRFFEDENIQQLLAFFGLFSRKLSGPSLAKHLPFLLCISVIPPISMVCGCGIILWVPFLSTEIQPMNINLDKPLRIAKLYQPMKMSVADENGGTIIQVIYENTSSIDSISSHEIVG